MLRQLLSNWLRQQAREKLCETVAEAAQRQTQQPDETGGDPASPQTPADVGFVFALGVEAGGLVDRLADPGTRRGAKLVEHFGRLDDCQVAVVESGIGTEAAGRACEVLIALRRPRWIVSAGFAVGLKPELRRGHVLMADTIIDTSDKRLSVGLKMDRATVAADPALHVGPLLTVDAAVSSPRERKSLGETHGAMACDGESMAVAEVCGREKVRFLSIRIISEAVDDRLPPHLEALAKQKTTAGKFGAATSAIFRKPASVKEMWNLKADAMGLSERLAKFLLGVVPQLGPEDRTQ